MKSVALNPDPTIQSRIGEMLRPRLYGFGVKRVRMLQTHTSWVFLTGDYAYKVKKPVNFGFLDYTTLLARQFFCHEEFRLNQRLSPDIYVSVEPICDVRGQLRLGGRGQPIDYCLKMKQLPQSALMTEQLRQGRVTFEHIDAIAQTISRFHAQAERGRQVAQYGSSEVIRLNWDENFAQTVEFRGKTITRPGFVEIKRRVERFIADNRNLFRRRREAGFVRRCHGDLHSKNIFIVGERVFIFDCIEFNPRFSCSDVAAEVAFMVMDLEFHGRKDLASFFVERYLVFTGDEEMLKLLDFYKCYRAYVRGKVTSFVLNDPGVDKAAKAAARDVARRYFQMSLRYARQFDSEARMVVMMGLPGTGKTHLARRLAERIDAFHLSSDSVRKQLLGMSVGQKRPQAFGAGIYASDISRRTYAEMFRRAEAFLRSGQSVILDATFLHEDSRGAARDAAERLGVPALFVMTDCAERTVKQRLRRRASKYGFSDAGVEVYERMKSRFKAPRPGRGLVRVDTRQPLRRIIEKIERALLHC
ncbi:MAG: AAA family ATPase [candidate division WOR-3 bacterium]